MQNHNKDIPRYKIKNPLSIISRITMSTETTSPSSAQATTKKQIIKKTKTINGEESVASSLNSIVKTQLTNMADHYNIYASAILEMEEKIKMLKNIMLSDTFLKNCKHASLDTSNIIINKSINKNKNKYSNTGLNTQNLQKENKVHDVSVNVNNNSNNSSNNSSNENTILGEVANTDTQQQQQQNKYFMPLQKDTLFWCFYIIYNGYQVYEYETNYFIAEQQFKIQTIERVKKGENKSVLKENKISKNFLEGGLMTNITPKILHALCLFYNINIFYVHKNTYYEIFTNIDKPMHIVKYNCDTNNYSVALPVNVNVTEHQSYIEKIKSSFLKLDNLDKPIRGIATYSVGDLVKICEKLDISIVNDLNKKKTKAELYSNILQKI